MVNKLTIGAILGAIGIAVVFLGLPVVLAMPFIIAGGILVVYGLVRIAIILIAIGVIIYLIVQFGFVDQLGIFSELFNFKFELPDKVTPEFIKQFIELLSK